MTVGTEGQIGGHIYYIDCGQIGMAYSLHRELNSLTAEQLDKRTDIPTMGQPDNGLGTDSKVATVTVTVRLFDSFMRGRWWSLGGDLGTFLSQVRTRAPYQYLIW
ncbi:hypothetical protein PoB_007722300 [Plakobranchus ocellatus]|uniref:Uncharacterized protein n=1 Tax=Plakobranchus ocellatus TaxID=259542 RepID=A0AAV4E2E1_9GAST|nr:hypothetical protein PoB_007722300 [Plakobranchus ocellatus]